jgi:hypothetical protein
MPIKEWANWSIFKNPGPFNVRHFAKYGRHDDEECIFSTKLGRYPRRLLPSGDKAIKVLEEYDLVPLTEDKRKYRETEVRNAIGRIDFCKRYEKAKPSAAAEKKQFLERAKDIREAAAKVMHIRQAVATVMQLTTESITESIAIARQQAGAWERIAAVCVVQRHIPQSLQSKEFAVMEAWWLLTEFRKWRPGVTREGPWQRLASILYDGKELSIGIEYLQRKHDELVRLREENRKN